MPEVIPTWRRRFIACVWLLLALSLGCTAAPLAGKSCPCPTAYGYFCCDASALCVANAAQCVYPPPPPPPSCNSAKLMSPNVTGNGLPPPSISPTDGGVPGLKFGVLPEQWVSYTFAGTDPVPELEATSDGTGIHVVATFGPATAYEGFGLSFTGDHCIDGTDLTGVQFEFDGDLGGRLLEVGVTSSEDINSMYPLGTCTADASTPTCYGPTAAAPPMIGVNRVPFSSLITTAGVPVATVDTSRIVNMQWQLHPAANPIADFTITNVMFY